ncbi:protein ALP1-like [Helianthus annuus]|uniref:protein ALP1-like n=1 Tax=Helianthus annuus TaxID=4232 RepID=UPI000B907FBC|nr:protein ALP1-like [Helianthus annuus]
MEFNVPSSSSSDDDTTSSSSFEFEEAINEVVMTTINLMVQVASEDNETDDQPIRRRTQIMRDRAAGQQRLMQDYFGEEPVYDAKIFRRRFRMSKRLFTRITNDMEEDYDYFKQKYDARGYLGFTTLQKCNAAIRQLAYGTSVDSFDEYLGMSARTARESLTHFCKGVIELYGPAYLRRLTWSDLQRMYDVHEHVHGFPGMIGSIDCMHWKWEQCPTAWRGTHTRGDIGKPSLILQAVASYDLWIQNAYFGQQGSHNDINVFESSSVLEEIINGLAPSSAFYASDNYYKRGYYLTDGVYPEYATFVKTFTDPIDLKRKYFKRKQESARKDIERAFRVLRKRWHVINYPARYWTKEKMHDVIYTCIILHNMILEDENKAICQDYNENDPSLFPEYWTQEVSSETRIENIMDIKNRETHNMLMSDLIDHLWDNKQPGYEAELVNEDEGDNEDEDNNDVVDLDLNEYVSDDE